MCVGALLIPASSAEAGGWAVKLKAPGHHPVHDQGWPIKVSARTRSGKKLHATALYKYLYQGKVVATSSPYKATSTKPYPFFGTFKDVIKWPARSVGYRLTFRVVVKARGRGKKHVDYWVQVV